MNLIKKIIFFWKKPRVVIVNGDDPKTIKKLVSQVLGSSFKADKEVLIIGSGDKINLSSKGYLILNFDKEEIRKLKEKTQAQVLTFGFQEGADFRATDIKVNGDVNFKVDYKGNIVPIWLNKPLGSEQIYAALSAIAVGVVFGLNLVKISQALTSVTK